MILLGVKEVSNWLVSGWDLTYPTGWEGILNGAYVLYDLYEDLEILRDDMISEELLDIKNKNDIFDIKEGNALVIRGFSKILKTPIMIIFYNQLKTVHVNVFKNETFKDADYQVFNQSICQYLDSIELAMHRKHNQ